MRENRSACSRRTLRHRTGLTIASLRLLDLLARQAADIIERAQSEEAFLKKNADLNAAYEEITSKEEELRQNIEELSLREKELIKSEADLKEALAEKEILLSEVHHGSRTT